MSKFKDQLEEMGNYSDRYPDGVLVFRVPISSLKPSEVSERRLIQGEWEARLESKGEVVETVVGNSGEHSLEWLCSRLRTIR